MTIDPKGFSFTYNAAPGDYKYLTEMYFKAKAREEAENATIQRAGVPPVEPVPLPATTDG